MSTSVFFFSDRRTLKFQQMQCNPTNKKTVALPNLFDKLRWIIILKWNVHWIDEKVPMPVVDTMLILHKCYM